MLPSVAGLSLSALRSPVPTGVGVKRQRSNDIAELYVRLADGSVHEFHLDVEREEGYTGTYVQPYPNDSMDILREASKDRIYLMGLGEYMIFSINDPEQLRKLADFSADSDPITLETIYGAKVEFSPLRERYGPQGFKIEVTGGRGITRGMAEPRQTAEARRAAQLEMIERVHAMMTPVMGGIGHGSTENLTLSWFAAMLRTLADEGDRPSEVPEVVENRRRTAQRALSLFGLRNAWASLGGTEEEITQRVLGWIG